jgi:hypothetical protein
LRSNKLYHHGTYSSRMKLPHAPTSITGFFLYRAPDLEREIDIEVFNDPTGRVMFTTYSGGRQTHTVKKQLPFDPTAGYHTYAFRYDAGLARFVVDGKVMQTWKTGVPKGSMYLYTNLWFPSWLDGRSRSWTPTCTSIGPASTIARVAGKPAVPGSGGPFFFGGSTRTATLRSPLIGADQDLGPRGAASWATAVRGRGRRRAGRGRWPRLRTSGAAGSTLGVGGGQGIDSGRPRGLETKRSRFG